MVNLPITTYSVANLGIETDITSNVEGIFHDGGGGATQNGYHVQVFADSMTTSDGFNFIHNSVAYYGFVCLRYVLDVFNGLLTRIISATQMTPSTCIPLA